MLFILRLCFFLFIVCFLTLFLRVRCFAPPDITLKPPPLARGLIQMFFDGGRGFFFSASALLVLASLLCLPLLCLRLLCLRCFACICFACTALLVSALLVSALLVSAPLDGFGSLYFQSLFLSPV